jgi:hypothetical protein
MKKQIQPGLLLLIPTMLLVSCKDNIVTDGYDPYQDSWETAAPETQGLGPAGLAQATADAQGLDLCRTCLLCAMDISCRRPIF